MDALAEVGLRGRSVFADKASGKDFNRPAYKRLVRRLKPGDIVYVKAIDRLGWDYDEIIEEWRYITRGRHAHIVVLDMLLLDTRVDRGSITGVFLTDVVLQLLSYVAQVERENIRKRQAEGIASAKARGVRFGRPRIERPADYDEVKASFLAGRLMRKDAAAHLGVSAATFDNRLRQDGEARSAAGERRAGADAGFTKGGAVAHRSVV